MNSISSRQLIIQQNADQRAYPQKGVLVQLGAVGGFGDLAQHGSHGSAEPGSDHHSEYLILWAVLIPHLTSHTSVRACFGGFRRRHGCAER